MTADTESRTHRVNGLGRGAGGAANGGDHVMMNGNGHTAPHVLSSATDDAMAELQPHEHDSDDDDFYTGMSRSDIVKKLKEIFGSNFSNGRLDEIEALSQILYGFGTTQLQQEQLDLIRARKAWLASKCSLVRFHSHLQIACRSCGQLGHTSDKCQQQQQAASAAEGGEDGSEAGSSTATGGKGKSSKTKRSKKAREAETEAKRLAGEEAAAKRQAAIDAGNVPAEEPAAEGAAALPKADGNGDASAKPRQKAGRGRAAPAPVEVEEVEEGDEDDGVQDEDGLLEQMVAAAKEAKSGKAAVTAAAAPPPPQRKAAEPARSGSAGASAADADEVAPKSAPPKHPLHQDPQPEQPQQDEGRGRRSGRHKGRRSGGGGGGGGDGGDERQAPTGQADSRTASMSRPGSSGGRQDSQLLRRERDGTLSQCYKCGEYGHIRSDCRAEGEVPRENWPKHPPRLPPQQQPSRQQQQEPSRQQQQQLQQQQQQQQQQPPRQQQQLQQQQQQQHQQQQPQQQQQQQPQQQQLQQQQPPPQQAQPVSPNTQGNSSMQHIHSALGHKPAEPGSWAHRTAPRASSANPAATVSPSGGYGGFTAPPAPDHFAAGGSLLPPPHQQPPPQHASMLPPEQSPEEDEDDGMSELLGHLGVTAPSAPAAVAWGGGVAAQSWDPPMGDMEPPTQPQLVSPPSAKNPAELERERREEADMEKALEASMKEQRGFGGSVPQRAAPTSRVAGAAAGLANDTGEYNCFLNAIIQCIWRCRNFKESILNLDLSRLAPGEGNPRIVRELVQLFRAMHEEAEVLATRVPENPTRPVVSPNGLREALSHCHKFQLGEMNDASEVLCTIYDALIDQGFRELVTSCFGLEIDEFVMCDRCLKESHKHSYTQYFQQVPAAALREAGESAPSNTLAQHLLQIDDQSLKSCDKDMGGCGRMRHVTHVVKGDAPKVFSIELAWQSNTEENETIADTLKAVSPNINASQRYHKLTDKWQRLCAMVCYYGQHYMAFVLMRSPGGTGEGRWILHDDANAMEVGDWDAVLHKCRTGRIQPSVLLYEDL